MISYLHELDATKTARPGVGESLSATSLSCKRVDAVGSEAATLWECPFTAQEASSQATSPFEMGKGSRCALCSRN